MSASKLYPKTYKGNEDSGGYIVKNDDRKNTNSPHFRGRVYVAGVGWYWVSGWLRDSDKGELTSLSLKEITDKEAQQYCAPRERNKRQSSGSNKRHDEQYTPEPQENTEPPDSDIPF